MRYDDVAGAFERGDGGDVGVQEGGDDVEFWDGGAVGGDFDC